MRCTCRGSPPTCHCTPVSFGTRNSSPARWTSTISNAVCIRRRFRMRSDEPRISPLGTSALLFDAPGATELTTQRRIWALAAEAERWPEVSEAVPGMNNVMLSFVRPPRCLDPIAARLRAAWADVTPMELQGKLIQLPVTYGGEGGPHAADVVAHTGLSIDDVAEIHSAPTYHVYALGSHPGYC